MLFLEQYPDLTDYEYIVSLKHGNLMSDLVPYLDYDGIRNWIEVRWTDENGWERSISPDDDSSLKDQTSIDRYGARHEPGGFRIGPSTQTNAVNWGKRLLQAKKNPQWRFESPLSVRGYLLDKQGIPVPACLVEPGDRIKNIDWPDDQDGQGQIFVMSMLQYEDENETLAITTGGALGPFMPNRLAGMPVAQPWVMPEAMAMEASFSGDGGGWEAPETTNWKQKFGKDFKRMGIDPWTDKRKKRELIRLAKGERHRRG